MQGCKTSGFSLLEVAIALAVALVIIAISIPRMSNVVANLKLRASMSTLSGFLQNSRMLAIKKNTTISARHLVRTSGSQSLLFYAKEAGDTSDMTVKDPQVELEAPITAYDAPTGTGAPPAISNSSLGLTTDPKTGDPSFNSRGLPCSFSGGACLNDAFIKYFKDNRVSGGWSAISLTPAGRIKRWFWNGSSWID